MDWMLLFRIICLQFLLLDIPSCSSSAWPLCHDDQGFALLQFRSAFNIDTTTSSKCKQPNHGANTRHHKTTSWENGTDCCTWHGVTCDMSGHVIELDLSCHGLQGEIHPNSSLFHLTYLRHLNLAYNNFYMSHISSEFGGFMNMTHLNLSFSGFWGEVRSEISHLSKLELLDLSSNAFHLRIEPSTWKRLMQNATALKELFLDGVDMSSIRPSSLSLLMNLSSTLVTLDLKSARLEGNLANGILCLPYLRRLSLSNNFQLQGQLPKCNTSLSILELSNTSFSGELPGSIGGLKFLTHLDLHKSHFQGSIPQSISNLTHLTYLRLSLNNFMGQIPSSLLALPHLTFLDISRNNFSGQIPDVFNQTNKLGELNFAHNNIGGELPSSLSNLVHLTSLDLSWNNFIRHVPDVFGELVKLEILSLASNNFTGQLPFSLFDLTQLSSLDCSFNKLEGPLPTKITGLAMLTHLYLHYNFLNGTIPSWCLSLPSLRKLWFTNNQFTGHIGAITSRSLQSLCLCGNKLEGNIPQSIFDIVSITELCMLSNNLSGHVDFHLFSKLHNLQFLSLSKNNLLSLHFNTSVSYNFPMLQVLDLSSCNLTNFPKFLGKFPFLQYLDLSNNSLHGKIWLHEMGKHSLNVLKLSQNQLTSMEQFAWKNLIYLDLSSNLLSGDISSSICNASSLQILNLSHNNLTGIIPPCFGTLPSLLVLDAQMNKLHGTLPESFSKKSKIGTLNLNGNQLEGPLPRTLAHCTKLKVLDLGDNQIEDTYPHWLQNLNELQVLVLRGNKFHGFITSSNTTYAYPSLMLFDVSNNNFSGPLPTAYIKGFKGMSYVDDPKTKLQYLDTHILSIQYTGIYIRSNTIHENQAWNLYTSYNGSVEVTTKGIAMTFVRILPTFAIIDLSENRFEGEIPEAFGELQALKALNLSRNKFIGSIPSSIGNLTNLESLDLSSNMLTGEVPSELTNLNYLAVLNLSHNQLVGAIPQGKQFNTFSNDSYEGNLGLCGFPLSHECNMDGADEQLTSSWTSQHAQESGFGWKPIMLGYGCGMVIGVVLGCRVFSKRKQWLMQMVEYMPNRRMKRARIRPNQGRDY